jgi:hypothetical protein
MTTPVEVVAAVMTFTTIQSTALEKQFSASCLEARRDLNDPPAPRLANGPEPNRAKEPSEAQPGHAVPSGANPATWAAQAIRG